MAVCQERKQRVYVENEKNINAVLSAFGPVLWDNKRFIVTKNANFGQMLRFGKRLKIEMPMQVHSCWFLECHKKQTN